MSKTLQLVVVLIQIVGWLVNRSVEQRGIDATRKEIGDKYAGIVDALLDKAKTARASAPSADSPELRKHDEFERP